jgi:hypothetical protein
VTKPTKDDVAAALRQAAATFQGEIAQLAAAHEILDLAWGDLFPLIIEYKLELP